MIKVGSAVLAGAAGAASGSSSAGAEASFHARVAALCGEVAALSRAGGPSGARRFRTVVTSGAVALGVQRLGLPGRPKEMALKQAAAAAGQSRLMRV